MPSERYLELLEEMKDLHIRKNAGYAGADNPDPWANFRECVRFGINILAGVLTRMSDKWSRLQSLYRNPSNDQVGESLIDTLKDLAAYCLIMICLLEEQQERDSNELY